MILHFRSNEYCYVSEALNYADAEQNCNRLNGILFEPRNEEENSKVYQTFKELIQNQVWIGINDIETEENFVYSSNSEEVAFFNWASNEPDNR